MQNWCQLCAWWSLLSYMTVVCNPSVFPVGSFMAGWPFAHAVESYSWTSAYYLLEVASVVMVGLAFYLLILLLRGLAANRQKQKQNWTSCTVDLCIFILFISVYMYLTNTVLLFFNWQCKCNYTYISKSWSNQVVEEHKRYYCSQTFVHKGCLRCSCIFSAFVYKMGKSEN